VKLGIVGYGVVGSAMARLFRTVHDVFIFDKFQPSFSDATHKHAINDCDLAFLSVPTPAAADAFSCDLSSVEECVQWIQAPLCIRSTVVPGTTDRLSALNNTSIAFSPIYIGESEDHPWPDEGNCGFLIVGGSSELCNLVFSAYRDCLASEIHYYSTAARTAELCKYMENCFLATKVAFVNQFFDIATALDVDFEELRNLWLLDSRVGPSHTLVTPERGFRGHCLPKDLAALIAAMKSFGGTPLLQAVHSYNTKLCGKRILHTGR
jgi:UDPglucose 6-dehydrogenase